MSEASASDDRSLVVIGSSAGGVEALGVVLSSIKADFPAPIVLAQHLDPGRPSQLASVLERRTTARVVQVNADTKLQDGTIYVVPSNRHVVIRDGHVGLDLEHGDRHRPSVDLLLSTAAAHYGERLVAVILTGSGNDGAAGAVDVKGSGGTVIIQNPATAAYPSMPHALPPTAVDHVADLDSIGPLLLDVLRRGPRPGEEPGDEKQVADVLAVVGKQVSIDFNAYKPATLIRRIRRRMAATHSPTLVAYRERLEQHPEEVRELVMALLIKVTEFFRDVEAFDYLRKDILPRLIQREPTHGRTLRLWSAGCSTGEEAYSLAMLLSDLLGDELPQWTVKIFATDVDESAIAFARRGLYPETVLKNLPNDYRDRFFEVESHGGRRVSKALRQMIIFGQQDLSRGVPFPRIDLLVCRNLLIYFKPELQASVLDLFAYSLQHTQGYLLLGKAETARPSKAVFELINKKWKVHRCLAGPLVQLSRDGAAALQAPTTLRLVSEARTEREIVSPAAEGAQLRRFNETVLRALPGGVIVIDRGYRIVVANLAARRLLFVRDLGNEQDFLHAVRGLPYSSLRSSIDQVFRERAAVTMPEVQLEAGGVGEHRFVTLTLAPLSLDGVADLAIVSVADCTDAVVARRELKALRGDQKELTDELTGRNKRLGDLNKELQDANEELQAANEEMMLAQEELQATNEEFEATNEELQSTNEELETNNEELQATNEELETTNDELAARSVELHELNRQVTTERLRLAEMVAQAPMDMILLSGPSFVVEQMNFWAARRLGLEAAPTGRTLDEVCTNPRWRPLVEGVRFAYGRDTTSKIEPISGGPSGHEPTRFMAVPTHDAAGAVHGVVVYALDPVAPGR